jgi:hypothetical protein
MRLGTLIVALLILTPVDGRAQPRVPDTGMMAVGAEAGAFVPAESLLQSGFALEGTFEYYLNPRASLRLGLGWTEPDFNVGNDSLRYVRIPFDLVYNWEGGAIHPFVGAGLAAYRLQFRPTGRRGGDSESKLGATFFGGIEIFNTRTVSIKGEARYHLVPDIRGFTPNGLAVTIGIKKYF